MELAQRDVAIRTRPQDANASDAEGVKLFGFNGDGCKQRVSTCAEVLQDLS